MLKTDISEPNKLQLAIGNINSISNDKHFKSNYWAGWALLYAINGSNTMWSILTQLINGAIP